MARRRSDERLSRERIVECAIALADAEGLEAVTIRRLAQDQGVTPMALYWHFKDKELLLDGIAERLLSDVVLPPASDEPWPEQLRAVLSALLVVLDAHPAVANLVEMRVLLSDRGMEIAEHTLGILRGAGFGPEQAAQLSGHALQSIISMVTRKPGLMVGEDPARREELLREKKAAFAALSPERFPNVVASADAFTVCGDEPAYFELGLDLFIAGVRGVRPAA
ncbi:TetR/AcrR family transcriptional regulator [Cryptosporangium phraense]|uniref:TetR family transcriptional regulator n=1 Tax=Cryptosporangium phraense TaxID=2593070 RepID=A0A545AH35_9ACTN|nr:TetR/AcrR family transcriptional regulator C-terminal domain-containing protein [Cryptosporangium phraense]TQS40636.1 TetR family transcriptional regulator [Cryptosporangium phraense]